MATTTKQEVLTLNKPTIHDKRRLKIVKNYTKAKTNSLALQWALDYSERYITAENNKAKSQII